MSSDVCYGVIRVSISMFVVVSRVLNMIVCWWFMCVISVLLNRCVMVMVRVKVM